MSAAVLREAAALMRERASDAIPGPWRVEPCTYTEGPGDMDRDVMAMDSADPVACVDHGMRSAAHIASWHPAVALAVAEVLLDEAALLEGWAMYSYHPDSRMANQGLVRIARAYLGPNQ